MMHAGSLFVLGSFVVACSAKVARFPQPGESLQAQAVAVEAGGKGFNVAVGARRLGAKVDGLLAIGDDVLSRLAEPALERADLPLTMLRRYAASTGCGLGFSDAAGETCLAIHSGANTHLSADDVRTAADAIADADLVVAQFEIADAPIAAAFALALAAGKATVLNPSPFRVPAPSILADTTILVMNEVEAEHWAAALGLADTTSASPPQREPFEHLATRLLGCGPDTVIVTLGAQGVLAFRKDSAVIHQAAFAVEAIDTLGAGDAFTAGLAVALLEGRPFAECLRRGAACGALATRRLGVFDALATRQQLECFLTKAG